MKEKKERTNDNEMNQKSKRNAAMKNNKSILW